MAGTFLSRVVEEWICALFLWFLVSSPYPAALIGQLNDARHETVQDDLGGRLFVMLGALSGPC
jgi:hypothetical protein